MAKISCPKCRHSENFNAQGKWHVICSECRKQFLVYIARQQPAKKKIIRCPHCGHQESTTVEKSFAAICPRCSRQFTYPE